VPESFSSGGASRPTFDLKAGAASEPADTDRARATGRSEARSSSPPIRVLQFQLSGECDPRLVLLRDPDSPRAASFRVLRHRLVKRQGVRVIAVSSAEEKAGKTTCAVNLALALAEMHPTRVLVIEANWRTPSLASLFGFVPPECISAQVARHRDRPLDPWTVLELMPSKVHIAAALADSCDPLLDGPGFAAAVAALGWAYDYVIIDTPPVLGSADVNLVADAADEVLMVLRARQSSLSALRRAVDQLQPVRLFGSVLFDI
jgi:Mrp family chromosome partitioning ATPase